MSTPRTFRVPVEVLWPAVSEAMADSGITMYALGRAVYGPGNHSTRLKRTMGLYPHSPVENGRYAQTVGVELATRIIRAAGVEPHAVGL